MNLKPLLKTTGLLLSAMAILVIASCGGAPKMKAMTVSVGAAATVNPDSQGRPSPVILHVLELKSTDQFNRLDYFSLTNNVQGTLGGDLVNQTQLVMTPDSTRMVNLELNPQSTAVGFVAGYRDMDNAVWRQTVELTDDVKGITVTLDQQRLNAAPSD
jgi:type VI secretion system protein VasD